MRLAKFVRPNGQILKAHLNNEQAKQVLTENGYKKWERGYVLNPGDYHDRVYLAALSNKSSPLIRGLKSKYNPREEQKVIAISALMLGALAWMGKKLN